MNYPTAQSKFHLFFPLGGWFLSKIWGIIAVLLFVALPVCILEPVVGLSFLIFSVFLAGVRVEISLTRRFLLSPFIAFLGMECLGKSFAPLLLWLSGEPNAYEGVVRAQIGLVVFLLPFVIGYALVARIPREFPFPVGNIKFDNEAVRPLFWIAAALVFFSFVSAGYEISSGGIDRASERVADYGFSLRAIFQSMTRLSFMGFVLLPYVFLRSAPTFRIILAAVFALYLLLMFGSGSRGYFFYPLLLSGIGYYIFARRRFFNYEYIAVLLLPIILVLIVVLDFFRQTEEFKETKMTNVVERLSALRGVSGLMEERSIRGTKENPLVTIGNRLDGSGDRLIYTMTPGVFPHVGFDNFDSILWIWVPYTIYKNRPITSESVKIIWMYRGVKTTAHMGFTTHADLYRRFGWFGVPIGGGILGILFGVVVTQVIKTYFLRNAVVGFLLLLLLMTLFQRSGFLTIPELAWGWGYDILKYVVVLVACSIALKIRARGVVEYLK